MPPCCKGRENLCPACTAVHKAEIKAAIAAGRLRPFGPQRLSPACTAFVSAMLLRDPKQRPSARQLLQVWSELPRPSLAGSQWHLRPLHMSIFASSFLAAEYPKYSLAPCLARGWASYQSTTTCTW